MNISEIAENMMAQSTNNIRQSSKLERQENRKSAAFKLEMQRLQERRSSENEMRKEMNTILSDIMTILKKTGDEIRK